MEFKIKLRAFEMEDALLINELRNQEDREKHVGGHKKYVSLKREQKWVEDIILSDSQHVLYFAITEIDSNEAIGYASISNIDYRNGTCSWGGLKLSPNVSGKGYGVQAGLLLLRHVFEEMRMVRYSAECQELHEASLKMILKIGFIKEGLMRKNLYKNGEFINTWLLSIIDIEYSIIKEKFNI